MPSASQEQLPQREIVPGYTSRLEDWGGVTVAFEHAHAGQDVSGLLDDLPDGRCQAPHWGFLFSGRIRVDYGTHTETISAGQAYYVAPGHKLTIEEDSEAVEFTPTDALQQTFAALQAKADRLA